VNINFRMDDDAGSMSEAPLITPQQHRLPEDTPSVAMAEELGTAELEVVAEALSAEAALESPIQGSGKKKPKRK